MTLCIYLCIYNQPSLVALALLALEVEEQHESESAEALRDAVKDLQQQLTVSRVHDSAGLYRKSNSRNITSSLNLWILYRHVRLCVNGSRLCSPPRRLSILLPEAWSHMHNIECGHQKLATIW